MGPGNVTRSCTGVLLRRRRRLSPPIVVENFHMLLFYWLGVEKEAGFLQTGETIVEVVGYFRGLSDCFMLGTRKRNVTKYLFLLERIFTLTRSHCRVVVT